MFPLSGTLDSDLAMLGRIFLLLTITTLLEMWVLFQIAALTSWWLTVAIVLATGFVGAWLLRWNGLRALARIRSDLAAGELPADSVLDGLVILIAGVLLMTPGVISDIAGLLLMSPILRHPIRALIKQRVTKAIASGTVRYTTFSTSSFNAGPFETGMHDASAFRTGPFPPSRLEPRDSTVIDMSGDR